MKIGIIGCGFVGNAYMRGLRRLEFDVIGYDKYKEEYKQNFHKVRETDVLFLCLPTVPKEDGTMDMSPFEDVLETLGGYGGLVIIKSTLLPGTTKKYHKEYNLNIVHSPEFLSESQALYDVLNPTRIVLGIPSDDVKIDDFYRIHRIFQVPIIEVDSNTSEFAKFMQNSFFATKVTFANEMAEISKLYNADYNKAKEILYFERDIGNNHLSINKERKFGGHCLKPDTLIYTLDGMRKIKDISIGEVIYCHDGRRHKVTAKFKRKINEPLIKIKTKGMGEFSLTNGHSLLGVKGKRKTNPNGKLRNNKIKNWNPNWIISEDIKRGDYLVFPKFLDTIFPHPNILTIPQNSKHKGQKTIPSQIPISKEFMRLLGYYLAEGYCDESRISFAFHEDELKYIEDVRAILKNIFGLKITLQKNKNSKVSIIRTYSLNLAHFLITICGKGAENKKLRFDFMSQPINLQKEIIKGAWRGDGSKSLNIWSWATTSKQLFNQMKTLLLRQEIAFTTTIVKARIDKNKVRHKESYTISIKNYTEIIKMNKLMDDYITKQTKQIHKTIWFENGYLYYPVANVELEDYDGFVYNLEVEGAHSYLCESATLHNCLPKDSNQLLADLKEKGKKPLLLSIVKEVNERENKLEDLK